MRCRDDTGLINHSVEKNKPKVVHSFDMEDLPDKVAFCRCWKSSKVCLGCLVIFVALLFLVTRSVADIIIEFAPFGKVVNFSGMNKISYLRVFDVED